jgi:hypothetical protein
VGQHEAGRGGREGWGVGRQRMRSSAVLMQKRAVSKTSGRGGGGGEEEEEEEEEGKEERKRERVMVTGEGLGAVRQHGK